MGLRIIVGSTGALMLTVAAVPGWYGLWPVSVIVLAAYAFFVTAFLQNKRAGCYGEIIDMTIAAQMFSSTAELRN